MYPTDYGLNRNPFLARPTGGEVFIGPQTAELVQLMRSGLARQDAVMTVSGAAGTGKTTLVTYALDAIAAKKKVVSVGRTQIEAEDVLESLLIVLGVENRPVERERRFAILRNALLQYETAGFSVFVIVENVNDSGPAILAELSALTAADAGESAGARIVLMGDDTMQSALDDPMLVELRQRLTHRHTINALSDMETRGYLLHCFRAAGGDFRQLFESGSCTLLHKLCDGNPRAINKLVDAVLDTAAEQNLETISPHFIAEIAAHDYDPQVHDFKFSATAPVCNASNEVQGATTPVSESDQLQKIAEDIANAESLDDLDDVMAETLFGSEIALVAAQVTGNPNAMEAANTDVEDTSIEGQSRQPAKG
jgi:general secretion pathway protein A